MSKSCLLFTDPEVSDWVILHSVTLFQHAAAQCPISNSLYMRNELQDAYDWYAVSKTLNLLSDRISLAVGTWRVEKGSSPSYALEIWNQTILLSVAALTPRDPGTEVTDRLSLVTMGWETELFFSFSHRSMMVYCGTFVSKSLLKWSQNLK